jgi:hypothetical protein
MTIPFRLEFTFEGATGCWGLVDDDLTKTGKISLKLPPEPSRHDLNRGTFQPFNVIKIGVVHHFQQRSHRLGNSLMVVDPADGFIHFTFNVDLHLEAVPMHLTALMVVRKAGKGMGGFEMEVLDESCAHIDVFLARG